MAKNYNTPRRIIVPGKQQPTTFIPVPYRSPGEETENPFNQVTAGSTNFDTESLSYKKETMPEIEARIEKEKKDSNLDRTIKLIVIIAIIVMSFVGLGIGFYLILNPTSTLNNKQFGQSLVTLILGAYLGFLAGKAIKS